MKLTIEKFERNGLYLSCLLRFGDMADNLTVKVNDIAVLYLTLDRIDAVVVGFLLFAMKNGYDIASDYPISKDLYFALTKQFIPSMCAAHPKYHMVRIDAPMIDAPHEKDSLRTLIGTGISCGVDSLYTIYSDLLSEVPEEMKVNTLFFFNVGAAMKGSTELRTNLVDGRLQQAKKFADEYKFDFIFMESNIHLLINKYANYSHIEQHTYMALFCLYLIQKGIKTYYYSSGYSLLDFDARANDSASYDIYTLGMMSLNGMHLYSGGGEKSRLEKVSALVKWKPAQQYLNVCVNSIQNDNTCFKCVRTMLEIDAVGDINDFKSVFDIDFYKRNYKAYLRRLYINAKIKKDSCSVEIYAILKTKITFVMKLQFLFSIIINKLLKRKSVV